MNRTHAMPDRQVPVSVLPDRFRSIFTFTSFNKVQSACFPNVYNSDDNIVVSAPTGAGKTVIFDLAILRASSRQQLPSSNSSSNSSSSSSKISANAKVVYIAPTRALCYERWRDWSVRFAVLGFSVGLLTGDTAAEELQMVKNSEVIITTPEKWDSTTRKWKDYDKLMSLVTVVLIDEVHILRESRGATLEAVVSRMKYLCPSARFVALSATIPNAEDIAEWLRRSSTSQSFPARLFRFGEEYRPVPLATFVYGYASSSKNLFQQDKLFDNKLAEVLDTHYSQKPIIIFCATRKIAVSTAKNLVSTWLASRRVFSHPAGGGSAGFQDRELNQLAKSGVVYHHAGLTFPDRALIEKLFLSKKILIICCTSTLAMGINLPAQMVIIKGTSSWADNKMQEYAEFDIQQMIGRAGRPQFDISGTAVIMTTKDNKSKYEQISHGEDIVESSLHKNLIEHMNAEIVLRVIKDRRSAIGWLQSTFLYVRITQNPEYYSIGIPGVRDVEIILDHIYMENIELLREAEIVNMPDANHGVILPTSYGQSMATFYIKFETMKLFQKSDASMNLSDTLKVISASSEFKEINLRLGEKKFYKEINSSNEIRFPFAKPNEITSYAEKVNLLIQAVLGRIERPSYDGAGKHVVQMTADKGMVWQHVHRLAKCLIDCKSYVHDGASVRSALELMRSMNAEVWDGTPQVLLQVDGIGPVSMRKLIAAEIKTVDDLRLCDAFRIEHALGVSSGRAAKLLQDSEKIPRFKVALKKVSETRVKDGVNLSVKISITVTNTSIVKFYHRQLITVSVLVDLSDGTLVDLRRAVFNDLKSGREFLCSAHVEKWTGTPLKCRLSVACEELVGTEAVEQIPLNVQSDSIVFLKQLGQRSMTDYRKITKSNTSGTKLNTSGKKGSTQVSLHEVLFLSSSSSSSSNTSPTVKPLQSEPSVAAENKSDGNSSSSIIYSDLNFETMLSDIRRENQSRETEKIEQSQPTDDFDLTSDDLRELTAPILPQSGSAKPDISRKRKDTNDEVEHDRVGAKKRAFTTSKIGNSDSDVIRNAGLASPSKIAQSRKEPMTTTSPARLNRKEPVSKSTYTEQHTTPHKPPSSSTFSTSLAAPSTSPSTDSTSRRLPTDSSSIMDISSTYDADAFFKIMENLRTELPQKVDAGASASSRNNGSSKYATTTTIDDHQQPMQFDKTSETQRQNKLRTPVKFAKLTDFLQEYVDIVDP